MRKCGFLARLGMTILVASFLFSAVGCGSQPVAKPGIQYDIDSTAALESILIKTVSGEVKAISFEITIKNISQSASPYQVEVTLDDEVLGDVAAFAAVKAGATQKYTAQFYEHAWPGNIVVKVSRVAG